MSFRLDSILQKDLLVGPETINSAYTTDSIFIGDTEDDFTVNFRYTNGSSVNMTLYVQVSHDNVNFSDVTLSAQTITDNEGSHIWDFDSSGALYLRVRVAVTAGDIEVERIAFSGKRRH